MSVILALNPYLRRFRRPQVGARPGTLAIAREAPATRAKMIVYSSNEIVETEPGEELERSQNAITWIDLQGLRHEGTIKRVAEIASIPDLILEDMVNVPQRCKSDVQDGRVLAITRMIHSNEHSPVVIEQVSLYMYKNVVVTFQEEHGDVFEPIRNRLRNARGPLRTGTADFLFYTLLDTIVDAYFPVLENVGDRLQKLEQLALLHPTSALLSHLTTARNDVLRLRRAVMPQKEVLAGLMRDRTSALSDRVRLHLEDTTDHCLQAGDVTDLHREMSANLLNLYMSAMANRTNDKMKVLTIMASIFIPLTFIAGVYGMNFEYMPELHVRWAYPAVWITMTLTAVGLLIFFYRKGWIIEHHDDDFLDDPEIHPTKGNDRA